MTPMLPPLLASLLMAFAQVIPEPPPLRSFPWYWPVGNPWSDRRWILQDYGQYETVMGLAPNALPADGYDVHRGIDIAASAGEKVRAPIAGRVISVGGMDPTCRVILQAPNGWRLSVTHLAESSIAVVPLDRVHKGELLGEVVSWEGTGKPDGFEHVHLQLTKIVYPTGQTGQPSVTHTTDPLPYLGGRPDNRAPFLRTISVGSKSHGTVAFVDDLIGKKGARLGDLVFHDPALLPQRALDVLVRAGDHFTRFQPVVIGSPWPFRAFVILDVPGPLIAPQRLSLRISPDPAQGLSLGDETVLENIIDFTGNVSAAPYLIGKATSEPFEPSRGWPAADLYFLLTHTELGDGSWQAEPGAYRVEVTVEDAAGNIASEAVSVMVTSP